MFRRHFFLIAAGALLLLMVVLGGLKMATGGEAKGKAGAGGGRAASVAPAVVAERPFADKISVLGVAKGRQSVTITSDAAELVTAVHFRDGQAVSRGQILVTLKATEQDAGVLFGGLEGDQNLAARHRLAIAEMHCRHQLSGVGGDGHRLAPLGDAEHGDLVGEGPLGDHRRRHTGRPATARSGLALGFAARSHFQAAQDDHEQQQRAGGDQEEMTTKHKTLPGARDRAVVERAIWIKGSACKAAPRSGHVSGLLQP